ncbi:ABC transporter permease/substrate-binding protein [Aurantiacibacter gangjinensis]|uniref:ABC transporter permease n=1 Tax=Aurantiacibacter gangjinensis TaxID=502682 RepID=A0A0G9ML15_9SPHN|nr:ABC transporter permease/substrate-binding protein [Aurantiacibacter gangjinensis]APE27260.1 ABC transporter permease protein [Aurantiacibacter gangjinensis]KLE31377.1 ABC transporter permease [Aurantiacibacter gangjinensis]
MSAVWDALLGLGPQLADHVLLSAAAVALGIALALPLAIWASRSPSVARVALGFASLVQTIPALALLALFFPILLAARALLGDGLPTLGFLPAWLALALYALLPILRNAVTAITNIDPELVEAADGLGMTGWQKLRLVEAPLAAPFIMAGIRTASVWTIGAGTLATTIGQRSLGDPIFAGLQTQNWALVLAGCIASAGLALTADALFGLVQRGLAERRPRRVLAGALLAIGGVALAAASLVDWRGEDAEETVVIGAKGFSEQYILARAIGITLEEAGYAVEYRDGLGSAVVHNAVTSGAIDIAVDYTGTIWTNQMGRSDNPGRDAMYDALAAWEAETSGALVLGRLGFENAYGLAVRAETANMRGIETITDLANVAGEMTIGGDPEFFERPEWFGVRDAYGLQSADRRNFAPTFMYSALGSGEADVISAYTSDGRIAADGLRVLDDPLGAFPNYDAIILLSPDSGANEALVEALQPLVGSVDVGTMRQANLMVDRDENKRTPQQAARWLLAQIAR